MKLIQFFGALTLNTITILLITILLIKITWRKHYMGNKLDLQDGLTKTEILNNKKQQQIIDALKYAIILPKILVKIVYDGEIGVIIFIALPFIFSKMPAIRSLLMLIRLHLMYGDF